MTTLQEPSPAVPADPRRLLDILAGNNRPDGAPLSNPPSDATQIDYSYTVAASRFSVTPTRPYLTSCENPPPGVPQRLWEQLKYKLYHSSQLKRRGLDQISAAIGVVLYISILCFAHDLWKLQDLEASFNDYCIFGFVFGSFYVPLVFFFYEGLIGYWLKEDTQMEIGLQEPYFRGAGFQLEVEWQQHRGVGELTPPLFDAGILTIRPPYQEPSKMKTTGPNMVQWCS